MLNIGNPSKKVLRDENKDLHEQVEHLAIQSKEYFQHLITMQDKKDRYKSEAENLHQKLGDVNARYQYDKEVHREKSRVMETTIIELADKIVALQDQLAEESEENEQKGEQSCDRQAVEQENDELKRKIEDLEMKLAGERQINANQADKMEQLQNRNANQFEQIQNYKREIQKLRDENTELRHENQAFKEEVKKQVARADEFNKDAKNTRKELQNVSKELMEGREKNKSLDNKTLREIIEQKNHTVNEFCRQIKGLKNNLNLLKQQNQSLRFALRQGAKA